MKAISIQQPWAHMILTDEKQYEYRSWSTDHRGDLLVCSSANPKIEGTIPGHALCVVEITDVIAVNRRNYQQVGLDEPPARGEKLFAWKIENVRVVEPFPVKGKLHLYEVPDEKIHIFEENDETTDEEVQAWFDTYFMPHVYWGKG